MFGDSVVDLRKYPSEIGTSVHELRVPWVRNLTIVDVALRQTQA